MQTTALLPFAHLATAVSTPRSLRCSDLHASLGFFLGGACVRLGLSSVIKLLLRWFDEGTASRSWSCPAPPPRWSTTRLYPPWASSPPYPIFFFPVHGLPSNSLELYHHLALLALSPPACSLDESSWGSRTSSFLTLQDFALPDALLPRICFSLTPADHLISPPPVYPSWAFLTLPGS
jgi:hypothetical protein